MGLGPDAGLGGTALVVQQAGKQSQLPSLALPSCSLSEAESWQLGCRCWQTEDGRPPGAELLNATRAGGLRLPLWHGPLGIRQLGL